MKTVDAIGQEMAPPGAARTGTALYSKWRIPSMGVEIGFALEYGHVGVFLDPGARCRKRLKRDDTDLAQYSLTDVNNTGSRIFMPATFGLHFRF